VNRIDGSVAAGLWGCDVGGAGAVEVAAAAPPPGAAGPSEACIASEAEPSGSSGEDDGDGPPAGRGISIRGDCSGDSTIGPGDN
jgi:hypothetical protein